MLQSVAPASYLRTRLSRPELQAAKGRRQSNHSGVTPGFTASETNNPMADADGRNQELGSDDEGDGGKGSKSKSRRELPAGAVQTLKAWLLSPEHFTHPYPTPQDQAMLMQKTGIDKKQLKNWFTNARRRIWKPMLKKQIEQGKLTTTGVPGGVAVPGGVPGLMVPAMPGAPGGAAMDNPHSVQAMRAHYQQAVQQGQPQQQVTVDAYGNQVYVQQQPHIQAQPPPQPPQHQPQPAPVDQSHVQQQYYLPAATDSKPSPAATGQPAPLAAAPSMHQSNSIGSLPPMTGTGGTGQLNKTDSHAVLMELFARDQDLVRQATESARMKAAAKKQEGGAGGQQQQQQQQQQPLLPSQPLSQQQQQQQPQQSQVSSQHPMKTNSQSRIASVPSLNSWPHFSSISSLNNLGNMPGVKSITSMSGVDLANQGNVNKMGNLAQVKSMESMGKNDSYAFLEVFFGDRSLGSMNNLGGKGGSGDASKGKREREEDNDVGLSLDDEGPSTTTTAATPSIKHEMGAPAPMSSSPQPAPLSGGPASKDGNTPGTLKRAFDDAMAARGLMSVSRSSEKLTDLALPAKMQRSLSQEYIRQNQSPQQPQQQQQQQQDQRQQVFGGQFSYTPPPADPVSSNSGSSNQQQNQQQYPGQHPGEPVQQQQQQSQQQPDSQHAQFRQSFGASSSTEHTHETSSGSVEVPAATKCAICHQTNVDTQLRPCGHMFHERCLKPSLQSPVGPPKCPVDHIPMQSALLAVPTDNPQPSGHQKQWNSPASGNQGVLSSENRGTSG